MMGKGGVECAGFGIAFEHFVYVGIGHALGRLRRAFAIDSEDREVAEIFATGTLGFADGYSALFGLGGDLGRKDMRQMVLAYDDLGIDAQLAGAAQYLDDASSGRGASSWIANQLDIHYRAIELLDTGDAAPAGAAF